MSLDSRTVSQIPSFCKCNCILKDFHNYGDFHLLWEFYSQYSLIQRKITLLQIQKKFFFYYCKWVLQTSDASSFQDSKISKFIFFIPLFSLFNFHWWNCFLASMSQRKKVICIRSYYHIWHSNLCITVVLNRNWSPYKYHKSKFSKQVFLPLFEEYFCIAMSIDCNLDHHIKDLKRIARIARIIARF